MSNIKLADLSDKQVAEMTKVIKIISESVAEYIRDAKESTPSTSDISLYAMQVLSLMCGLSRGYSSDYLNEMWENSTKLSKRLHAARKGDKVDSPFQKPVSIDTQYKN